MLTIIKKAIFYKSLKRRHSMVSVVFRFIKTSKYLQLRWALLGPKNMFDWAQKIFFFGPKKYLPIENTLWARGRDWVRFEIVRVSDLIKLFDQLRFVWPCPDSKEENWLWLKVIRNMNATWISCKYTIIISGLSGRESSRWYLTSEDWPLALAGWLIGSLQDRMF